MFPPRCALFTMLLVVMLGRVASAAGLILPPLNGEIAGDFKPLKLAGAPALHWKISLRSGGPGADRTANLAVDGPGTQLRAEAQLDAAGDGTWRLLEAQLDLAAWFAVLAPSLGAELAGIAVEGKVALTGDGTLRGGTLAGRAHLELRDGAVSNATQGWEVKGVAVRGDLGRLPALASDSPFRVTFGEAVASGVTARDGVIEFTTDFGQTAHLLRAECSLLDGRVELTPFVLNFAKPEIQTDLHFAALDLGLIASLLPPVLAEARGRLSGRMTASWSAAAGFITGSGRLEVVPGEEGASLQLAASPGFLTSHVPKRLAFLPGWLGPVAKAFSPENPAYETLRAIEMGEMRLEVNSLDVGLQPEGDGAGRTARVVVTAQPVRTDVVKSVRFEINVAGPLADVIRMGLEGRVKVRAP